MTVWLALAGCGILQTPSVGVDAIELSSLDLTGVGLTVDVEVENPLWVDVTMRGLRWELLVRDTAVVRGADMHPRTLMAGATTTLEVPLDFTYDDLWGALGDAFDDETVPYRAAVELDLVTPRGGVTLPVVYEGELPAFRVPSLELVELSWDVQADGRMRIDLGLDLGLPEGFSASQVQWSVDIDAHRVGEGKLSSTPGGKLQLPLFVDASAAASASWDWWWGEARSLIVNVQGNLSTPMGTVPLDLTQRLALSGTPP